MLRDGLLLARQRGGHSPSSEVVMMIVILMLISISNHFLALGSLPARSFLAVPEDGCYVDQRCSVNASNFDLTYLAGNGQQVPDMTRRLCSILAAAHNFTHAALQRGHICFGVNGVQGLQQAPPGECDMPCNGNADDICGSYCLNSISRVSGDTHVTYTGWTDNTTTAAAILDDNPQLCPPGQYITGWTFGWQYDQAASSKSWGLLQIQGNCSQGGPEPATVLQPAVGSHGPAGELEAGQYSASGFTCSMLQQDGVTETFAGAEPGEHYVAGFLGEWKAYGGGQLLPWAICGPGTPEDWVAIGYERTAGDYIRAMRFILASRKTLKLEQLEQARAQHAPPPADPAAGCYEDAPCLKDPSVAVNLRALPFLTADNEDRENSMTRYKCAVIAAANGHPYAALEFGSVCYGADSLQKLKQAGDAKCNYQCLGSSEMCGGDCNLSAYSVPAAITVQYSARTDNETDFKIPMLRDSSQLCPEAEYITRFEIGLGPWNVTGATRQVIYIWGYCSRGSQLLPASGDFEEYEVALSVNSTSGFTCSTVQNGSSTQWHAPQYPTLRTLATFMGHGQVGQGLPARPWAICQTDMPADWVVVGYESQGVHVIENMRFIFASRKLVHAIAPPVPIAGSRHTNTSLGPAPPAASQPSPPARTTSDAAGPGQAAGRSVFWLATLCVMATILLLC